MIISAAAVLVLVGAGWLGFELSRLRRQIDQAGVTRISLEQREKELQKQRIANSAMETELERVRKEKEQVERQMELERQIAGTQSPNLLADLNIATFRLTAQARTAGQISITIPSGTDYIALQVELDPDDYPSYNAVLLTQPDQNPLGLRRERLKSKPLGNSKVIKIIIPATVLKSGTYLLEVTGISDKGIAEGERGYPFRVVKN